MHRTWSIQWFASTLVFFQFLIYSDFKAMKDQKSKLYLAGRNSFVVFIVLVLLTFVLESFYGCSSSCDQNTFDGLGVVLIVLPAIAATFAVSLLSLILLLVDRYRTKGSQGKYRKRGAYLILSLVVTYIIVLSSSIWAM